MTYEEENKKIEREIIDIDNEIDALIQLKESISQEYSQLPRPSQYDYFNRCYEIQKKLRLIDERITLLKECQKVKEGILKENPRKRKIRNALISTVQGLGLDKLPEPPRHVSGRVYEVSDGCFYWMLGFVIIGFLIIMIWMS